MPVELTNEDCDRFHQDGYLVVRSVFGPDDVARMAAAFDELARMAKTLPSGKPMHEGAQFVLTQHPDRTQIHRVVWCGAAVDELLTIGADPRLLALAAPLLGDEEMDQLINQAHFKEPNDEVAFGWHQDSRHRRYGTPVWTDVNGLGSFVETITAIDPMHPGNGALKVIPGTGQLGHVPTDASDGHLLPVGLFDPGDAVTLTLQPGDVMLLGPYTLHGSGPNRSTTSRRLFLNGYAAPGANRRVYPGEGSGRRLRFVDAR